MLKRIFLVAIALAVLSGAGVYYYVFIYSASHRSAGDAIGLAVIADSLAMAFEADEVAANGRYLRQVLRVTGTVLEVSSNQQGQQTLLLGQPDAFANVFVTMETPASVVAGDLVTVKGFCDGFLSDVVITGGVTAKD